MNIFYNQSKFFITLMLLSVASLCGAQIKVDYNALPDYDYVPPVKQELGVAGGNRINTVGAVKSKLCQSLCYSRGVARPLEQCVD